ncbi:MAG: membrane dipeptidase, partial [Actinobacteria bacterium]|nr:membrane dipeptidase [Actinomycetota bacterium]
IDYIAGRIGIDHVAFGSDFEGTTVPDGLTGFPALPYGEDDVAKVTHRNWLRVLERTWKG